MQACVFSTGKNSRVVSLGLFKLYDKAELRRTRCAKSPKRGYPRLADISARVHFRASALWPIYRPKTRKGLREVVLVAKSLLSDEERRVRVGS